MHGDRLPVSATRYFFTVKDFHSLLFADLPAYSPFPSRHGSPWEVLA